MTSENPSVSRDTDYLEVEEVVEKLCIAKGIEVGARILVISKNDADGCILLQGFSQRATDH